MNTNLHNKLKQAIKNIESLGYRIETMNENFIQAVENTRRYDSKDNPHYRTNFFSLEEWQDLESMKVALEKQYRNEVQ